MKRDRFAGPTILAFILLLVTSDSLGPAFAQGGEPGGITNREYKLSRGIPSDSNFDLLGVQRREMCEIVHAMVGHRNPHTFIFKRPIR